MSRILDISFDPTDILTPPETPILNTLKKTNVPLDFVSRFIINNCPIL